MSQQALSFLKFTPTADTTKAQADMSLATIKQRIEGKSWDEVYAELLPRCNSVSAHLRQIEFLTALLASALTTKVEVRMSDVKVVGVEFRR